MRTGLNSVGFSIAVACSLSLGAHAQQPADLPFEVGAAKVDITPSYPVRLNGYGGRRAESSGVTQRIWARALALSVKGDAPAILIVVENLAVPARVADEVASRIEKRSGVPRERFALASTHTHSAPMLHGICETLFGEDIPPEHQSHIDRYTIELADLLEKCVLDALAARAPSRLAWGRGTASFAGNRRTKGGPVDHDLPVLRVSGTDGKTRAIVAGYACHCTALSGEFNEVCGDWAGYAAEAIEAASPGVIALVTIGCGGDADPYPRTGLDFAKQHGAEIAAGAKRLLRMKLAPVTGKLEAKLRRIEISFSPPPDRKEWEARAAKGGAVGYHARRQLARLDRGEALQIHVTYPVQTWSFGEDLAMVFLAGEVVVDYSLRLKSELDASRLWVTAYSNDVPCYIPSRRVLAEGGYEGGGAMVYYDRPCPFDPSVEDKIIDTVHALVPEAFRSDELKAEFPPALSPEESRSAIRVKSGLTVELVAAEPLVIDPVAIDFGIDGALWVCEMNDYPMGLDGNWKPGGRVRRLVDSDGDGRYDKATLFLEDLSFPTGVMAWRRGVIVCAAPEIIFAEDTDGDGKADVRRVLFTGFETHNYQARVNGLSWGLDNWVYGACGLFGGKIRSLATGETIDLGGRDFRMNPDTGAFEPAAGTSQQGRVRDDWGNWFGNENWSLLWHFPLPDHYVRRNPHAASPNPRVAVAGGDDPNRLYPASRTLRRFNDPDHVNRTTSACGPCIYRDELLGKEYEGNAFVCEPVHNLVTRLVLEPRGATFEGHRADDEKQSELLASKDSWFRPVQALTGPDGALWIVDMYRFVIEHPRWIPAERLAQLDVRAGADKGRIYRVYPAGVKPRSIRDLSRAPSKDLAAALDSPCGPLRDLIHRELVHRQDSAAAAVLMDLALHSLRPATRVQALCALDGLNGVSDPLLRDSLRDTQPQVKAQALRLAEGRLAVSEDLQRDVLALVNDADFAVRFQLALSLGEWNDVRAGEALGRVAVSGLNDSWLRAAVLSSALHEAAMILSTIHAKSSDTPARAELVAGLIATAAAASKPEELAALIETMAPRPGEPLTSSAITAIAGLLDAAQPPRSAALTRVFGGARELVRDGAAPEADRAAACTLLARRSEGMTEDLDVLASLLAPSVPAPLEQAAVAALARSAIADAARILVDALPDSAPAVRAAALSALMSREAWIGKLLDALEAESIRPSDLDAAQRQKLSTGADASLRARAEKLFEKLKPASRSDVIAKYSVALSLAGDESRGAAVFTRVCSTCHAFRGQGRAVGPNLAALNDKGPQFLFTSILDPNTAVEPKYLSYAAATRDGRVLTGMVAGESSNALTIVAPNGVEERVLRKDLAKLTSSGLSLMPEGLEQSMTPSDLADLIAYMRGGPRSLGSSSAAEEAAARARFLEGGTSGFADVVFAVGVFQQPSWIGRVTMHYCRQNDGKGKVVWRTRPVPSDLTPDAMCSLRLAAAIGFVSQPSGGFTMNVNGRASLDFNVAVDDASWQSADGRLRMIYTVLQNNAEDSTGVLVIQAHASLLEPGKPALIEVTGSAAGSERWFGVLVCPDLKP